MIYIDILVFEDLIFNYIIILSTSIILNRITKFKRIFLSSVIGLIPIIFLLINTKRIILDIINLIIIFITSIIAFKYKSFLYTFKNIIYMYFISIFIAGSIYLINTNYLPNIDNYILKTMVYIIILIIEAYIYTKHLKKIKNNNSDYYKIDIYLKGRPKLTLMSFLDTGNNLKDPYNNKPIILVTKEKINITNEKIILVPYNTIDNHGLMKCFSPEKIYVHKVGYKKKLLIGIINEINIEGADCIMNKLLIERI